MEEQQTRTLIDQHADAVVRGDMDHVVADFAEHLRRRPPDRSGPSAAGYRR
jgi:hypothetical protein